MSVGGSGDKSARVVRGDAADGGAGGVLRGWRRQRVVLVGKIVVLFGRHERERRDGINTRAARRCRRRRLAAVSRGRWLVRSAERRVDVVELVGGVRELVEYRV